MVIPPNFLPSLVRQLSSRLRLRMFMGRGLRDLDLSRLTVLNGYVPMKVSYRSSRRCR